METRSSRHTSIRKISEIVRPSLRATSLFVSPDGSLANSSNISKPFSRAGVRYRLEALGAFVFINSRIQVGNVNGNKADSANELPDALVRLPTGPPQPPDR